MDDLESKLNSLLQNPEMMQQIMSMAQSFTSGNAPDTQNDPVSTDEQFPNLDLQTIQKISSIANKANIDTQQKALLNALSPYLSKARILKLEKAMRAAKMAQLASTFLNR